MPNTIAKGPAVMIPGIVSALDARAGDGAKAWSDHRRATRFKILARGENEEEHFERGMTRLVGNLVRY